MIINQSAIHTCYYLKTPNFSTQIKSKNTKSSELFFNLTPIGSFKPNTTQPHYSKTAPISKANTFPQQKKKNAHTAYKKWHSGDTTER